MDNNTDKALEIAKDFVKNFIQCKDDDLDFLLKEFDYFNVSVNESLDYCKQNICGDDTPHINDLLRAIYVLAIKKHKLNADEFEMNCNYRMSQLTHIPTGTVICDDDCLKELN